MRNKYAGCCADCRAPVPVGAGYFDRRHGRFVVRCMSCVVVSKKATGKPLSFDQQCFAEGIKLNEPRT